jgi:hypothetical protein
MKPSELPGIVKTPVGMQTILGLSMTVELLRSLVDLEQTPGGGWSIPGRSFSPFVAILFSPLVGLSWLSAHHMWKGKELGWILGISACFACALGFFILDKPLIVVPALCLIALLLPPVRDFYTTTDEDLE